MQPFGALGAGMQQLFVALSRLAATVETLIPMQQSMAMILNSIAQKLKRQSKDDFQGRYCEARLIVQAVTWYLRYPLRYRDLNERFSKHGFEVDHSTINR